MEPSAAGPESRARGSGRENQELKRRFRSTSSSDIAAMTGFTSWSVSDNSKRTVGCIISLKDSCAKGFRRWADAYQPEIKNELRASESRLVSASPDQEARC